MSHYYSLPSYKAVTFVALGEFFIKGKIYLKGGSSFGRSKDDDHYTTIVNIEKGEGETMIHDKEGKFVIDGVKCHWMADKAIPDEAMLKFPICFIKKEHARDHLIKPTSELRILHEWNEDWILVRLERGIYYNLYTGHITRITQQTIFD